MSKENKTMSPQELMRQAVAQPKEQVSSDQKTTDQVSPTGRIFRLPSYPMTIRFGGETHIFETGIVRPISEGFLKEMEKLVEIKAATEISAEEAERVEAFILRNKGK